MSRPAEAKAKTGWNKIKMTCKLARARFKYAWVDTCCIDKSSSAELTEAINSMYAWYRSAEVCYVYLSDLSPVPEGLAGSYRGWTLQELIASKRIEFYDKKWNMIGDKGDLLVIIQEITRIDMSILRDSSDLQSLPVARRMSWVAGRRTTRVEDIAYCLLGIFDVNMPLLYGEGTKAFQRLQQHIATETNDLSLFAWQKMGEYEAGSTPEFSGIFADSPEEFSYCSTLMRHRDRFQFRNDFTVTNNGLQIKAQRLRLPENPSSHSTHGADEFYALSLDCLETSARTRDTPKWLAIWLLRVGTTFVRAAPDQTYAFDSRLQWSNATIETFDACIRRNLYAHETARLTSFIRAKIVINYDSQLKSMITSQTQTGNPSVAQIHSSIGDFVFDCHGRDNFAGTHTFAIQFGFPLQRVTFGIVCGLQWDGSHCQPWAAIFDEVSVRGTEAALLMRYALPVIGIKDEHRLLEIRDYMLCRYTDQSGLYKSSLMPKKTTIVQPGTHITHQIWIEGPTVDSAFDSGSAFVFTLRYSSRVAQSD
ncbi:Vegetative incompatibility protein HET-E-1-like protein 26 [Colletotrichum chlorophyti]|uniref:Vegetative incompatibility protein HET-E-1-like protein 26 n=1 Tax=Colletotrichum chlorophyti TaxID=708187 RepID=A0A1Q8RAX4_9PEZI|nr:Vegetative incompatibility protein HET-E-1-like protein 26 [Colletotrichum chlorophyti]